MPHTATRRRFVSIVGTAATAVGLSGSAAAGGTDGSTDGGDESGKNGDGTGEDDAVETTRFATFNIRDLTTEQVQSPGDAQAAAAARVIQGVRPDVLVLNEITNNFQEASIREVPTDRSNARAFAEEYLSESQRPDIEGLEYDFEFTPTSNTGVFSGFDFDNNGTEDGTPGDRTYGNDSFGFGEYPGQYALAILSKKPIDERAVRTFRTFAWADMPDSLIIRDEEAERYLNDAEARAFRLSSKTHADIPIEIGDRTVNALLAHPTPPVFDGPANFNGRRTHDEIRLLADYVAGEEYVYDDSGLYGGLDDEASCVLMGDMNAGPGDEESLEAANEFLLDNEDFGGQPLPTSPGGTDAGGETATFDDGLTIDYVLPSPNLDVEASDVVWPAAATDDELLTDVEAASDHRLVWADLAIEE
jgi:endonuclease/exonuclease/phosphatase family metal-dependent hydrolase